ncbi:MAG: diacylglycerol/lipid kinase family protein [Anaerolineaceae bacterium]
MNKNPLLIYNPIAAQEKARVNLPLVESLLQEKNFSYELILTDQPGAALLLAKSAAEEGRDLVIAAGGDGTVNEVINGIMRAEGTNWKRPALGVLPVGRGNDYAFGIGIPHDFKQAVEILVKNQRQTLDVGKVTGGDFPEGRFFGNGVGLGFDTVVGFEAMKIKWLHGIASYLLAVIRTMFLYAHAPVYELSYNAKTIQQPYLMVSIMNGRRMGGSFMMAPTSSATDGKFDLCLAGDIKQHQILPVAVKFMSGTQEKDPHVKMDRTSEITIKAISGKKIPAHADGETICVAGDFLKVEIVPSALDVITNLENARL